MCFLLSSLLSSCQIKRLVVELRPAVDVTMSFPTLDLYILSYNCAHNLVDVPSFSSHILDAVDHLPEFVVVSLQEISPMSHGLVGGTLLSPYINRVEDAVEAAARKKYGSSSLSGSRSKIYTKIATRNIGMVVIMAFARDPDSVNDIESANVGVGVGGMANKGAVGLRFVYTDVKSGGETELTFVAAHLAAMEWELERRNEDWKNIVKGLVFTPSSKKVTSKSSDGRSTDEDESVGLLQKKTYNGIYKRTSHLFLAGDLNYRTSTLKPSPTDHETAFPQPKHPKTSPQNYSLLFENDQLTQERLNGRTCHGLAEAPVTFPPTYKYVPEKSTTEIPDEELDYWHWAHHRWPSWTDRILFLDLPQWLTRQYPQAKIELGKYIALPLFKTSDHRAVALSLKVPLLKIPEPDDEEDTESNDPRIHPPFEIDPEWKAKRAIARKEELLVGLSAYLTATWEGWCIILGTVAGFVGGYFLLKAALDF